MNEKMCITTGTRVSLKFHAILILVISLFLSRLATAAADEVRGRSHSAQLLEASSFRLVARIRGVKVNVSELTGEIVSQEFYSNQQKRARIELYDAYENVASPRGGSSNARSIYYHDSKLLIKQAPDEQIIRWKQQSKEETISNQKKSATNCQLSSSHQFSKDLLYEVLRGREMDDIDWLKKRNGIPDHVIGAARLLLIIDQKRNSLKRIVEKSTKVRIRNHDVVRYNLIGDDVREISPEISQIRVSYPQTTDHDLETDLPLRALIILTSFDEILIDYSLIGPLIDDEHEDDDNDDEDDDEGGNGQSSLDLFALPVGINCTSQLLDHTITGNNWSFDTSMDASFQTEIFRYSHHQDHHHRDDRQSLGKRFVAYDGHASIMRSDSLPSSETSSSSYSTTIIDFAHRIKYNILADGSYSMDGGNGGINGAAQPTGCISAEVSNSVRHYPFLNFPSFVPIGQSIIRGASCLAFEQIATSLPANLFPHLSYRDNMGADRVSFGLDDNNDNLSGTNYNIVYHFASYSSRNHSMRSVLMSNRTLGPLMRVDVYLNSKLSYHMEILDFVYELVDAPNGDRRDELFSLRDRCTSGKKGNDGFASILIWLETLEIPQQRLKTNNHNGESILDEAARLLKSQAARNNAIMRGLSRSTSGLMKNIYDLESHLKFSGDNNNQFSDSGSGSSKKRLEIFAQARMSVDDVGVTVAKHVGYVANSFSNFKITLETSEDCFFRVAHHLGSGLSQNGVALFASCSNWCSYDLNPRVQYSSGDEPLPTKYDSEVFTIYHPQESSDRSSSSSSSLCPVFVLETDQHPDDRLMQQFFGTFRSMYVSLKDRTLPLLLPYDRDEFNTKPRVDDLGPLEMKMIDFKVKQVDISNDRWSVSQGYERAEADSTTSRIGGEIIESIGLTEMSGSLQSSKISDDMNYERCHSLCMSWMKCQSFSICLTSKGIECITSEWSFRDGKLLERIHVKLDELREKVGNRKGKTIQIQLASDGGDSDEGFQEVQTVELKADFRCRLYKKNVLELFHKQKPSWIKMNSRAAFRLVGNLEKCAELCVRNNLIFFRKMEKIERNILDKKTGSGVPKEIRDEYKRNLSIWCSSVKYLNLATSSQAELIKPMLDQKKLEINQGLCILSRPTTEVKSTTTTPDKKTTVQNQTNSKLVDSPTEKKTIDFPVKFETYGFRYSNLYKVQYGIQLRDTNSIVEDKEHRSNLNNVVALMPARDAESCASMCFLQTNGPDLGCKSFDFVEPNHHTPYCALNSISLAQIEQNNQSKELTIDRTIISTAASGEDNGEHFRVWHYEPRSFTIENAMISARKIVSSDRDELRVSNLSGFYVQGFGIFLIVFMALTFSFVITLLIGPSVMDMFNSHLEQQRRNSLSNVTRSILETYIEANETSQQTTIGSSIRLTDQKSRISHQSYRD